MTNIKGKFNIYKEGKLEYSADMEIEDGNFILDISEDVIEELDA
jgi:hypothetical protein